MKDVKKLLLLTVNQKPALYAAVYLVLIPIFGCLYTDLPGPELDYSKTSCGLLSNLYYSVVTITTLGYGDIVPKNSAAQVLAAIESILGVVFIGLFLNALSQQLSRTVSEEEKSKEADKKLKAEIIKLGNFSKIVELNMQYLLMYTIPITVPISQRGAENGFINEDFTFNDMQDLYKPTLRLSDNHYEPAVNYYFKHLSNLETSIKELIYHVDLRIWPDFELRCINFLKNCKELDFSGFIKNQPNILFGEQKGSEYAVELIKKHSGPVQFSNGNMINPYVALYFLVKNNLQFIREYRETVAKIGQENMAIQA